MKSPFVQSQVFDSGKPGPSLLVLGAVHGNGICGTIALNELVADLNAGRVVLQAGRLVAVPVANPAAYALKKRLVESNLNRLFSPHPAPRNDEERAANDIMPLIDKCDVLLDIHSCHRLDKPFAFLDHDTPANRRLAVALGFPYVCTGWNEVYKAEGIYAPGPFDYADNLGKTCGFIECGWEDEPPAVEAARRGLRNCLGHLGMLPQQKTAAETPPREIVFRQRIVRERPGRLLRDWTHFDPVAKGAAVARYDDGQEIVADQDGFILFPTPDAAFSEAWFYFGTDNGLLKT